MNLLDDKLKQLRKLSQPCIACNITDAIKKGYSGVTMALYSLDTIDKLKGMDFEIYPFYEIPKKFYTEKRFINKILDDDDGQDIYLICWNSKCESYAKHEVKEQNSNYLFD